MARNITAGIIAATLIVVGVLATLIAQDLTASTPFETVQSICADHVVSAVEYDGVILTCDQINN